jgi:hypothetical protein
MFDPQDSAERLCRNRFRSEVLDWLIEMATANSAERTALDKMIWSALTSRGVQPSVEENKCRSRFCTGGGGYYEYSALVDVKLSTIPY